MSPHQHDLFSSGARWSFDTPEDASYAVRAFGATAAALQGEASDRTAHVLPIPHGDPESDTEDVWADASGIGVVEGAGHWRGFQGTEVDTDRLLALLRQPPWYPWVAESGTDTMLYVRSDVDRDLLRAVAYTLQMCFDVHVYSRYGGNKTGTVGVADVLPVPPTRGPGDQAWTFSDAPPTNAPAVVTAEEWKGLVSTAFRYCSTRPLRSLILNLSRSHVIVERAELICRAERLLTRAEALLDEAEAIEPELRSKTSYGREGELPAPIQDRVQAARACRHAHEQTVARIETKSRQLERLQRRIENDEE
jgi:hypothetical protein